MVGFSEIFPKDESSHRYVAYLCTDAAMGIDFMMQGKENEFNVYVPKLAELLDKYSKKCTNEEFHCWPYLTLLRAFEHDKKKEIKNYSDLSLEMRLIADDLADVKNLPKERQKELLDFCCLVSQYFLAHAPSFKNYLAA